MIELKSTQANITLKSPTVVSGSVDLSNYYTKAQVDALIPDVSGFATEDYVDNAVNNIPEVDLSGYALKSEIPDVSGFLTAIPEEYVTESELNAKGYLTEHQSLDGYAKLTDIPDVSGFQTEAQVNTLINNALGVIENGTY